MIISLNLSLTMSNNLHQSLRQWFWGLLIALISTYSFGQTYCTPKYNFVDCNTLQHRVYIYNVSLNNRQFSTSCSQAGYAGVVNVTGNGINDPIVLTSGFSYNMTVNTYDFDSKTYSGVVNQSYFSVWIDYDNNGVFDNYEFVRSGNSSTFNIFINSNAGGNYRMRIRVRTSSASDDPCAQHDIGETEDYILKVTPPTPIVNSYMYQYPCANSSFTLSASGCSYGTIQWRDQSDNFVGNNPATVQTSQNKSYYATCVVNGAASPPSANVYVYPTVISPPSVSSNNYNLTVGQSAALTATGCYGTVIWSNGQIGNQITITPNQTTTYSATCSASYYTYCTSGKSNEVTIGVNAPSAPVLSVSKNIICPGETVTLSAANCNGTLTWRNNINNPPISGASSINVTLTQAASYSVSCTINGVEGAKASTTISVNQTTAITKQPTAIAICEGSQGALGVEASGNGNLSYVWTRNGQSLSDSSATTSQLVLRNTTTASNGSYQVKVTGACGTVSSNAVNVQVSPKMTASAMVLPATCSGDANGSVTATVSGGLDGKQYRLANQGVDFQSSPAFTNLRAGSYTIQVRDPAGCTAETSTTVTQPDRIVFALRAPTNAKCAGGSDGAIEVKADGGNGGYLYSVNGGTPQSSGLFQNLKANTNYVIKAADAKGCSETTGAFVGSPNQIVVNLTPTPVDCAGGSNGQISAVASGGLGSGYQFQLNQNQPQPGNVFLNLTPASYTVTVKDANGCEGKADVTISQPTPVSVAATATLVSCLNDSSATIIALASGGTGLFQYQANTRPFQSTTTFSNVREGSYTITAKDTKGCSATTVVTVKKAEPLLLQATVQAASCCTCPDGSVLLISSGGIGQKKYQFSQQALQAGNTFKGVAPGKYVVTVRDEAGCPTSQTVTITNANAVTLALTNLKNVNCAGGRDGSATVQATVGPGGGFIYAWKTKNPSDSLGTGATVTRLPEGEFTVTVTDTNRCSVAISGTLTALNPLPPKPTISTSGGSLVSSAQSGVQWYRGTDLKTGKLIANATQPTFTPFESNSFFVVATVSGCVSPPSDAFNFILTAVEVALPLAISVIPNPVSNQLLLEVDQPERAELHVRLMDMTGKTVLEVETPAFSGKRQFSWPLSSANAGNYLLQVDSGLHKAVQRVVVH